MVRTPWYRRAAVVLPLSAFLGVACAELALRYALFGQSEFARDLAPTLRDAGHFADAEGDDDYWKLRRLLAPREKMNPPPNFDAALGWTGARVEPGTYRHRDDAPGDARRLVLLYGDSYAQCMTEEWECFPAILAESELGATHRMLDYGVIGYGLDQTYLMIERSIDLYRDQKPIVIVGLLVENTLERTVLTFREWPKPRLKDGAGALEIEEQPLASSFDEYLEEHPLRITSYLWRYLTFRSTRIPEFLRDTGHCAPIEEKQRRGRALLLALDRTLRERGLDYFVLFFHSKTAIDPPAWAEWQEPFVREVLGETGARIVTTRPYLKAALERERGDVDRLYQASGPAIGHLTGLGNAAAFEAMRDGIAGDAEHAGVARIAASASAGRVDVVLRAHEKTKLFGRAARIHGESGRLHVRSSDSHEPPFEKWTDSARSCLTPGAVDATRVDFELDGRALRLRTAARAVAYPSGVTSGTLIVRVEADGRGVCREELAIGGDAHAIDVDLTGVRKLSVSAVPTATTPPDARLCFCDPVLE